MSNPWFKFYGNEFLADPKMAALTAQERSCWMTLLCLANASSTPGIIEFLTVEVLLIKSGIVWDPYHPEEWERCLSVLKKLEKMKIIKAKEDGTIELLNWKKRQETYLTDAERSKNYRDRKKERHEIVTDHVTNDTIEQRRGEERREEKNREEKKEDQKEALPLWLDKKVWSEWLAYRKESRKPMSAISTTRQLNLLEQNKEDHVKILEDSMTNGWTGLFPLFKNRGRASLDKSTPYTKGKYEDKKGEIVD